MAKRKKSIWAGLTEEQIAAKKARMLEASISGMERQSSALRAGEFDRPASESRDDRADYLEDVLGDYAAAEAVRAGRR